jgi:hypothetical protein
MEKRLTKGKVTAELIELDIKYFSKTMGTTSLKIM